MSDLDSSSAFSSSRPSAAGIYDYLIGGGHHTPADAESAMQALAIAPEARFAAVENRKFLQRAVEYLAKQGVRQYLDLGSGYPTGGQVHEVAARIIPDPHVVYVDCDPHVAQKSRELLKGQSNVAVVTYDVRGPYHILNDSDVTRLIDWSQPVALLAVAILHFINHDDDPAEIIAAFRERMSPGSYLTVSHASGGENPNGADKATRAWDKTRAGFVLREPSEIEDLFVGFDMVGPGIVTTTEWGTSETAPTDQAIILCGVGKVP
jgi:S-adenosyl methyltransferase